MPKFIIEFSDDDLDATHQALALLKKNVTSVLWRPVTAPVSDVLGSQSVLMRLLHRVAQTEAVVVSARSVHALDGDVAIDVVVASEADAAAVRRCASVEDIPVRICVAESEEPIDVLTAATAAASELPSEEKPRG